MKSLRFSLLLPLLALACGGMGTPVASVTPADADSPASAAWSTATGPAEGGAFSNPGALAAERRPGLAAAAVPLVPPKAFQDFNGDGRSDLLWQNGTDLYAWFMTGSTYTFSYLAGPPGPWQVVGKGDFDGDGNVDVLWRNGSDMYVWFMHGAAPATFAYLASPPSPWEVAAVGDFDGDGKADILWRNGTDGYVWFMNGGTFTWAYVSPPPAPWEVAAVGDFDGDGKADLLWRRGTDGYAWFMNGGTFTWAYFPTPAQPWTVSGSGDFDGDGKADLLWKNGADMYIWYMHGALPVTFDYVAGLAAPWQLVQVGDFDGDGKSDLLWRNGAELQSWSMNGPVHAARALSGPPVPWGIVGQTVCAPSAPMPEGTACGAGLVCSAGTCGAPAPGTPAPAPFDPNPPAPGGSGSNRWQIGAAQGLYIVDPARGEPTVLGLVNVTLGPPSQGNFIPPADTVVTLNGVPLLRDPTLNGSYFRVDPAGPQPAVRSGGEIVLVATATEAGRVLQRTLVMPCPADVVVASSPPAGSILTPGSTVTLTSTSDITLNVGIPALNGVFPQATLWGYDRATRSLAPSGGPQNISPGPLHQAVVVQPTTAGAYLMDLRWPGQWVVDGQTGGFCGLVKRWTYGK